MTETDFELISALTIEMSDRAKIILDLIPKEKEFLLKNLAAASIHLALFMRDLSYEAHGKTTPVGKAEKRFLDECGCKKE